MPHGPFSEPPKTVTIALETDEKCICDYLGEQVSVVAKMFIREICFFMSCSGETGVSRFYSLADFVLYFSEQDTWEGYWKTNL